MTTTDQLFAEVKKDPTNKDLRLAYADALHDDHKVFDAIMQRIIAYPSNNDLRRNYAIELKQHIGTTECKTCKGAMRVERTSIVMCRHCHGAGAKSNKGNCVWCSSTGKRRQTKLIACPTCSGSGQVSNGNAELAEFIEVQIQIAETSATVITDMRCPVCRGPGHWRSGVGFEHEKRCGKCNEVWEPGEKIETRAYRHLCARENELWPIVQHTFEWLGCKPWIRFWPNTNITTPNLLISRGFPTAVRCKLAGWFGSNRAKGIGPQIVLHWPIERVKITDAVIQQSSNNTYFMPPVRIKGRDILSNEYWQRLQGHKTQSDIEIAYSNILIEWAMKKS